MNYSRESWKDFRFSEIGGLSVDVTVPTGVSAIFSKSEVKT